MSLLLKCVEAELIQFGKHEIEWVSFNWSFKAQKGEHIITEIGLIAWNGASECFYFVYEGKQD